MMRFRDDDLMMPDDDVERLYAALVDAMATRPGSFAAPVTVAEIYQDLVPYRLVRASLGYEMNADYEHTLLRLLAGVGELARLEPIEAAAELREELDSPNPNVGLFRKFAGCDVWIAPPETPAVRPGAARDDAASPYAPPAGTSGAGRDDDHGASAARGTNGRSVWDEEDARAGDAMPADPPVAADEATATAGPPAAGEAGREEAGDRADERSEARYAASAEDAAADRPADAAGRGSATEPDAVAVDARGEKVEADGARTDAAGAGARNGDDDEDAEYELVPVRRSRVGPPAAPALGAGGAADARGARGAGGGGAAAGDADCPFCEARLPARAHVRFCPFCGNDQRQRPCVECGEPLEPEWRYCVACGTAVPAA